MTALLVISYDAVAPEDRRRTAAPRHTLPTPARKPSFVARVRGSFAKLSEPLPTERYESVFPPNQSVPFAAH